MKRLKIFVASPSDVAEERDLVTIVVDELRRMLGGLRDVELETVRWETHAWPDVDDDAQAVINKKIGEYDVFIGVMWRRFGTPTRRSASGTGEEFERAYESFKNFGRPRIMFYFRTSKFYTTDLLELEQFTGVIAFRKKLEEAGVLFWQYEEPLEFERFVREHLIRLLLEITTRPKRAKKPRIVSKQELPAPLQIFLSAARQDVDRVLPIAHALSTAGFRPWLDVQNLLPGQIWETEIERAIEESDVVLVFLSRNSVTKQGFVQKEVRMALDRMKLLPPDAVFVIPVMLDMVEPPQGLRELQWVDVSSTGGIEYLIQALRAAADRYKRLGRKPRLHVAK